MNFYAELEYLVGIALNRIAGLDSDERKSDLLGHKVNCYGTATSGLCVARAIEKVRLKTPDGKDVEQYIYAYPLYLEYKINGNELILIYGKTELKFDIDELRAKAKELLDEIEATNDGN